MNSVLVEIIINNQCNKRCPYCDLDFHNTSFDHKKLDVFTVFLQKNQSQVTYFHINFFGGEPLLSFDKIRYFIENQSPNNNRYSLGTNGLLLTKEHLDFFRKHNFRLFLSIDNITGFQRFDILEGYEEGISINFINDPDFMKNSRAIFDIIGLHKFHKIHCMPVYSSKDWDKNALTQLLDLKKYIDSQPSEVQYFSYFNGLSIDVQFVLDSDMVFYKDIDSLLWLQKQYKRLPLFLREKIHHTSRSHKLEYTLTAEALLASYDREEITDLVLSIPKYINTYKQNLIIEKIFHYGS